MTLERYVENAWLRREATSPQEIADQLGIVSRSLSDAAVEEISERPALLHYLQCNLGARKHCFASERVPCRYSIRSSHPHSRVS